MESISIAPDNDSTNATTVSQPFEATWSPSKSGALDTDSLQILKRAPRAWERAPHSPAAEESRFKKVWKRYELRSQITGEPVEPFEEPQDVWEYTRFTRESSEKAENHTIARHAFGNQLYAWETAVQAVYSNQMGQTTQRGSK